MTRRPSKVAAARGAAVVLALLLAAACGQKSNVRDSSAAPAAGDATAGGNPGGGPAGGSSAATGDTVATAGGAGAAAPAGASTGAAGPAAGSSSAATPGRATSPSGGTSPGASPGNSPASAAGPGSAAGRTPSSAAGASSGGAGGGGGKAAGPVPVPAPPPPGGGDRTGVTDTKIRIGIHAPITGAAPFPQNAFDKGKDVYWKMLAEKGGIFGRNVEVVFRDDQFNPSRAVQVCREMVEQEKVFVLLGAAGSEQITACARYANSMGVPYLSAGVNEDGLTGLSSYFATSQTYAQQSPVLVSYIANKLHKTKIAIVLNNTPALNETQQSVTREAQAAGLNIVRNSRIGKNASDSELLSEANALRASGAEVVYLLTSPVNFIKLATNAQAQAYSPIYMGPGITNGLNIVAEAGCPAIGSAKFLSPFPQLDVIDNLDPDYQKSYQKYNGGKGDDIGLAEWGLSKVIGSMLQAAGKDLSRQSLVAALESGREFGTNVYPLVSYSGSIRFGARSSHLLEADCSTRSYKTIAQFTNGF
ncbi:MAG: branched-chain amino acid transport system substrate-binding protein [Actinomycetota bacterium]|nr:branched-chain amino acid transport system substrate-binding protein [Actinomycetota bacterium]